MATVEKRIGKGGKVSYRITVAAGTDITGKQIRIRRTWEPPKTDMTSRQIEKALSRAVNDFEREVEQGYRLDHKQTFAEYAEYVLDLKQRTGTKIRTIERYQELLKRINVAIGHLKITDIRPQHLNAFYKNLGEEGIREDGARALPLKDLYSMIKERGYTKAGFSRLSGIATATLSGAFAGKSVKVKTAEGIAKALGAKIEDLFTVERDTSPLSTKTILEHHRLISTVLSQAEKEMLIQYNPASKATPPKQKKKAPDYYQPEEISIILEAIETAPVKWKAATYLLIDTGCRRGEIAGLKWECVNLDEGIINIERALLYSPKHGVYEGSTKTDSVRILRIAPETVEVLKSWKAEQDTMRMAYGDAWINTGYVLTRDNGDNINPDTLTKWLNDFSKARGLPHIHPHAFRHTAASNMIANGVDIVTAANELGHSSATTTANIYAHQIAEAKAKAGNVRASIFKNRNNGTIVNNDE